MVVHGTCTPHVAYRLDLSHLSRLLFPSWARTRLPLVYKGSMPNFWDTIPPWIIYVQLFLLYGPNKIPTYATCTHEAKGKGTKLTRYHACAYSATALYAHSPFVIHAWILQSHQKVGNRAMNPVLLYVQRSLARSRGSGSYINKHS